MVLCLEYVVVVVSCNSVAVEVAFEMESFAVA